MANLRMVLVDVDCETPAEASSILRSALQGMESFQENTAALIEPAPAPKAATVASPPAPKHPGRTPAQAGDDSIRGKILATLQDGPKSVIEIQLRNPELETLQIGPACSKLRDAKRLVQTIDGDEETRRWHLVGECPCKKCRK